MPDSAGEWVWWVITAVLLAAAISLGVNLATPHVQKFLEQKSEDRRAKRIARNEAALTYVEKMLELIEEDKSVLTVVAHRAARYEALANFALIPSYFTLAVGVIAAMSSFHLYVLPREASYILSLIILVCFVAGYVSLSIGNRIRQTGDIYNIIILAYQSAKGIPAMPDE